MFFGVNGPIQFRRRETIAYCSSSDGKGFADDRQVRGALKQTDAATAGGRILRTLDAGTERFAFSYKTPHDPGDANTYDPEYYALALLRVDETASPEWRYIALVIEPNRIALREWKDDALLQEATLAEDTSVVTQANDWYEVEVRYGATDLAVYHAKRGNSFPEEPQLTLDGLTVTAGSKVGFGVGTGTDFAFDNLITAEAAVDLLQATFRYDALGRRIAKSGASSNCALALRQLTIFIAAGGPAGTLLVPAGSRLKRVVWSGGRASCPLGISCGRDARAPLCHARPRHNVRCQVTRGRRCRLRCCRGSCLGAAGI